MNYVVITDIFGNKLSKRDELNNFIPALILHTTQPHLLLKEVTRKEISIWKLNNPTIAHILYTYKIKATNFAPLGHLFFPNHDLPNQTKILLINSNKEISDFPIDYVPITEYNGIKIWRVISRRGFRALSYVASKEKPNLNAVKTIKKSLTTSFREENAFSLEGLTNMNEFNFLSLIDDKKFTLKRTKFLNSENLFRIISKKNGKFITKVGGGLKLSKKKDKDLQSINYTVQGELKIGNECVGVSMDENIRDNFVYLQRCDDTDGQKWYPYRGSFISQFDGSCLTGENEYLKTNKCDFEDDQKWHAEDLETVYQPTQEDNNSWVTQKGKKVILIEPDNPWYIKRPGNRRKPKGIIRQKRIKLNEKSYRNNADFKSKFMMDIHNPSMGYGYSYASRLGRKCGCAEDCDKIDPSLPIFEDFNGDSARTSKKYFNFNIIACSLFMIIFILMIVRFCLNKQTSQIDGSTN